MQRTLKLQIPKGAVDKIYEALPEEARRDFRTGLSTLWQTADEMTGKRF